MLRIDTPAYGNGNFGLLNVLVFFLLFHTGSTNSYRVNRNEGFVAQQDLSKVYLYKFINIFMFLVQICIGVWKLAP